MSRMEESNRWYTEKVNQLEELIPVNQAQAMLVMQSEILPLSQFISDKAKEIGAIQQEAMDSQLKLNNERIVKTMTMIGTFAIITLIIGVGAAYMLSRRITKPLVELTDLTERVTSGDLTVG